MIWHVIKTTKWTTKSPDGKMVGFIYTVLCHIPWFNDVLRWCYGPISHNATGDPATESSRRSISASPVTCRLKLRVSCDTRGFTLAAIVTIPWKPTMTGGHTFYIIPVRKGYNQFHKPLLGRFMVYWVYHIFHYPPPLASGQCLWRS